MKAFDIQASDTSMIADRLTAATVRSRLSFRELPAGIGIAARGAQVLGASLTDTIIALGQARNVLDSTERAATGVATSMSKMVDPRVIKELRGFGIDVIDKTTDKFKPFLNIVGEMSLKFRDMSEEQSKSTVKMLFGERAISGFLAVVTQLNAEA